jgi:hypothetical protein
VVQRAESPDRAQAECKKGGYKEFGVKNQGSLVAFTKRAVKSSQEQSTFPRGAEAKRPRPPLMRQLLRAPCLRTLENSSSRSSGE